ncbi:hypothetical protein GGI21_000160 [Coemansia aciculifera]|nr:hypothetical protein GGI21_000160 [Coemansia aciculifera]
MQPQIKNKRQLRRFARSVGTPPLFYFKGIQCYGDFVRVLVMPDTEDKSMWQDYRRVAPVLKHCRRLQTLDLSRCLGMNGDEFVSLFSRNPWMCYSLTSLSIGSDELTADILVAVISMLRNVKRLNLDNSHTDNDVLYAIAKFLPYMESLSIDSCDGVSYNGIQALLCDCPNLTYLSPYATNDSASRSLIREINARGGHVIVNAIPYDVFNTYDPDLPW